MRFTVLTPTYNRANPLWDLFHSLQRQSFRDFEWVIVDDGSTDNTEDVVAQMHSRWIWKTLRFPAGRCWEDLSIYHLALFQSPRIAWIDTPLYYYFQNSNGTSLSDWQPWKLDFIHAIKGLLQDPQIIERKQIHNVLISVYIRLYHSSVMIIKEKQFELFSMP